MTPTFPERQDLTKEYEAQVERMQRCLQEAGHPVKSDYIFRAWSDYSDSLCATWLMLPDDDGALLNILLKYLPSTRLKDAQTNAFTGQIVDAGDGSGDGILELPDELLAPLGWKEGDTLSIETTDSGELLLKRIDDKILPGEMIKP